MHSGNGKRLNNEESALETAKDMGGMGKGLEKGAK